MEHVVYPKYIVNEINHYNYYITAKEILADFYKESFIKKPTLKKELRFWSSFVNKKYSLVISADICSEKDISSLRKEIELVAGF